MHSSNDELYWEMQKHENFIKYTMRQYVKQFEGTRDHEEVISIAEDIYNELIGTPTTTERKSLFDNNTVETAYQEGKL